MPNDEDDNTVSKKQLKIMMFEYERAQEMLCHYDRLNWTIGSVLIAGILALTGLVLGADWTMIFQLDWVTGTIVAFFIPVLSLFVLLLWLSWFLRHRVFYNVRNEVLQRIESRLGMFHFLHQAELDHKHDLDSPVDAIFARYRRNAGYAVGDETGYRPLYSLNFKWYEKQRGYRVAIWLALGIPSLQFVLVLMLVVRHLPHVP